ncbi:hypothetical protein AA0117_g4003 [Alternaria alternata]|uniref:Wings apart-like protein C-terminal domain-containing protein n=1 Tax=Alternaria alternata TaxID=5599 RepID=A0A4Q4NL69_ALTAL|nr:uncharacterized protein J4E82_001817 [Alternaria postmessia]KAI5379303.1 hypothetical protein J4E82_001817 [Alternaria postmessia]RYN79127.1 hypothetical protein AA0117_g4003 [Alternaria alternata]
MATTMFANFTSSDRRKRVYGKASRHSALPPPLPDSNDDAPPSPERPRKHTAASNGSLNKAGSELNGGSGSEIARAKTDGLDIFDVPSEDEFLSRPKPTKKIIPKRRIPEVDLEATASSKDDSLKESKKPARAAQPLRKPDDAKPIAVKKKKLTTPAHIPKPAQSSLPSSSNPAVPRTIREKTPKLVQAPKQTTQDHKLSHRPVVKAKAPSEAATVASSQVKVQKTARTAPALPAKKALGKAPAKPVDDLAVFDVPMSDEEAPPTVKKISRQAQSRGPKEAAKKSKTTSEASHKDTVESDDSNASKKRKRQGSASSTATVNRPIVHQKPEQSVPQRSRKYQKNEDGASPGHGSSNRPITSSTQKVQPPAPTINKPTKTRQRTVPVLASRTITKGQSSPAMLNGMIPGRQPSRPSPVKEVFEVAELEDETMYDIPDPLTTPVRQSKASMPGSITPRQKDLFGGLLSDSSSSTTPMPNFSNLQLTDRKPRSLIGSLARSKSDVTHSAKARKTRLIDTLKPSEPSSDGDEEGSSQVGDDSEVSSNHSWTAGKPLQNSGEARLSSTHPDNMDVDNQGKVDSQTSQNTSGFGVRPKLTYAMARSYLREDNPEDDLLISMDLDDGFGSQSQRETRSVSESDAENSQAQAQQVHELRTRGRNAVLHHEAEMMIEETSATTSKNIRRSAMIDLCTKMADEKFCDQLLDSALAHQFFQNISVSCEIVFDFVAAVATVFVLRTNPAYSVLGQLYETGSLANLIKLAGNGADIKEIAKDRKTNLSKIAKESVLSFRALVQQSYIWSPAVTEKVSPQLVALKAIELLIIGLRKAGNADMLLNQTMISQIVEIASASNNRSESNNAAPEDDATLEMVLSILESTSATRQIQATWSTGVLQQIAKFMPRFFQPDAAASTMLAVKLCMNLTNNKPKACQPFSTKAFVQPLMQSIVEKFRSINTDLALEERTEILDSLILSLGAAINLAELSDQMRLNVADETDTLVEIFLDGLKRASQAASVEESHSGVATGYLGVLIGNLSLNEIIRTKVRMLLPNKQLDTLVDSIKDFVRVHQHVDQKEDFDGAEGQEALQTYTARLMLVVEKLQNAGV